MLTVLLDQC